MPTRLFLRVFEKWPARGAVDEIQHSLLRYAGQRAPETSTHRRLWRRMRLGQRLKSRRG